MIAICNGAVVAYLLSNTADVSQWPHVYDGDDEFINGLHFEPTIVEGVDLPSGTHPRDCEYIDGVVRIKASVALALAKAKLDRWEEIKTFRDTRLDTGGYQASGHWYNSDVRAKGEQSVLAGRADRIQAADGDMSAQYIIGGEHVLWKTMDNGYVPMTANLALAIRDAAEAMTVKTYKAAATHQYFLNLSTDPANYDFSAGWPAIFGE